jgi:hypothetical protein
MRCVFIALRISPWTSRAGSYPPKARLFPSDVVRLTYLQL